MTICRADGTESRVFRGVATGEKDQVVVYVDEECPSGWKGKIRGGVDSLGNEVENEVDYGPSTYRSSDMKILRKGKRFLMVLPVSS